MLKQNNGKYGSPILFRYSDQLLWGIFLFHFAVFYDHKIRPKLTRYISYETLRRVVGGRYVDYWVWAVTSATDDANNWWNGNNRAIAFRRRWNVAALVFSREDCPTGLKFQGVSTGFNMYSNANPYSHTNSRYSGTWAATLSSFDLITG